jgi:hypothetical protein
MWPFLKIPLAADAVEFSEIDFQFDCFSMSLFNSSALVGA